MRRWENLKVIWGHHLLSSFMIGFNAFILRIDRRFAASMSVIQLFDAYISKDSFLKRFFILVWGCNAWKLRYFQRHVSTLHPRLSGFSSHRCSINFYSVTCTKLIVFPNVWEYCSQCNFKKHVQTKYSSHVTAVYSFGQSGTSAHNLCVLLEMFAYVSYNTNVSLMSQTVAAASYVNSQCDFKVFHEI